MKVTATEQLLKDHRMIRKLLEDCSPDNPRFSELLKTLERVVLAHAWFEDTFLMPALQNQPLIHGPFWKEVAQEHEDIAGLLTSMSRTPMSGAMDTEATVMTLRTILEAHFMKEEEALFPLAEKTLSRAALVAMAEDMERRKTDVRPRSE